VAIENLVFPASTLVCQRFSRASLDDMEVPIADLSTTLSEVDLDVLVKV
jgi:hypothetical protein